MTLKYQIIILYLLCICFTACVIVETEPELHEFHIVDGKTEKTSNLVEIAATSSTRKSGLMYRKILESNHGMLLDYKRAVNTAIWMKNTYIPLDIIFIDINGVIVKIHEGAEPHSIKTIESEGKVRAVLEINAGQVRQHNIRPGDQVLHSSFNNI
jgi:uncharacterized membrane protein (UPF0127 family)